jgi:uncharacterized repeat protein (TIGR03803 family)
MNPTPRVAQVSRFLRPGFLANSPFLVGLRKWALGKIPPNRQPSEYTSLRSPLLPRRDLSLPTGHNMRTDNLAERGHKWARGGFGASRSACCLFLFCALTAIATPAQTFTTLIDFDNSDGARPAAPPVQGLDGQFYGTTTDGGTNALGTVFKITSAGQLTTLYNFCSLDKCGDGANPFAQLLLAIDGDFYGTTSDGGTHADGSVFKITSGGKLTRLYSFRGRSFGEGAFPNGSLIQGTDGNLYGTTGGGGRSRSGTVFKMTPVGKLTTLYSFCAKIHCTDGSEPDAGLVQATDGNFYGTTIYGGANGEGTVFKITPTGRLTVLYSFCSETNCTDGENPYAGLAQATNGDFYGTTIAGGANGYGTVFKITSGATLSTLHSFCAEANCTDGSTPTTGLVQGTAGNFYGATLGGTNNEGTAFRITPSGQFTTLYNFDIPSMGFVQGTDGKLYGVTAGGGTNDLGTVYSLSVGYGPFVETVPTSGKVGTTVKILGTKLTGSTSVSFNGTTATFTVVSSSEIDATVPTGATTGKVKVITPRHKLSTNVPFRVTK